MFRTQIAIERGVEKNLLFVTWGGLGDQICAEPTIRYALKMFKDCKISLASEHPELFKHLKFHEVIDLKKSKVDPEKYFVFQTITPPDESNLVWQFFSHMLVNCIDFPSMCALRLQLPTADKEIQLEPEWNRTDIELPKRACIVHAGKHWPSKTFPKDWWDQTLRELVMSGITPVLIGADTDDNRGTVDVDTDSCLDLRNKLSIEESTYLCKNAKVVLTNDSSPLHMAASGDAWIGFIATCKHPDMISHWRHGEFQWHEENLGLGGIWDLVDFCPNKAQEITADEVDEAILRTWLPNPSIVAYWVSERC